MSRNSTPINVNKKTTCYVTKKNRASCERNVIVVPSINLWDGIVFGYMSEPFEKGILSF
jgi:hypothetical protein